VVETTAVVLTWASTGTYRDTIWGELARSLGGNPLPVAEDVLAWHAGGAVVVAVIGALAFAAVVAVVRPLASLPRKAGGERAE